MKIPENWDEMSSEEKVSWIEKNIVKKAVEPHLRELKADGII